MRNGSKNINRFAGVEAEERRLRKAAETKVSAEKRQRALQWAIDAGFEKPTFAAEAALFLKAHGKPVTAQSVRDYLPIAYPFLSTEGETT